MAPYYAGDALTMIDENPDLAFVSPEEGVNFFVDSVCIPASSKHEEAAEMFMDLCVNRMSATRIVTSSATPPPSPKCGSAWTMI